MTIVQITTDNREHFRQYQNPRPWFGTAPEALLQGLARTSGVRVHVLSCTQLPVAPAHQWLTENIEFHSLVVPKLGWMRTGYQGCIRAVRRKLREIRPDIVHGQGTERECAMCAVLSGYPNVLTIHGIMADMAHLMSARIMSFYWLSARLERWAVSRTFGVFCNSRHTQNAIDLHTKRTWLVPNAVREEFFISPVGPRSIRRPVLLNIGQIYANKQQLELLQVARDLRRKGFEFELRFLGDTNPGDAYSREFLSQIQRAETEGWARHLGFRPMPEVIQMMDESAALIHVPRVESFGLVVAEALARNVKLFAFRTGGVIDIGEGAPGAELLPLNDWAGLSSRVQRWLQSQGALSVGTSDLMRSRYHPDVIAAQHLDIYREVLGR